MTVYETFQISNVFLIKTRVFMNIEPSLELIDKLHSSHSLLDLDIMFTVHCASSLISAPPHPEPEKNELARLYYNLKSACLVPYNLRTCMEFGTLE